MKKKLTELPASSDTEFWGDAQINKMEAENAEFFTPREGHDWIQQGPYLICDSCSLKHATRIGMGKQLVGFTEDGKPILKNLSFGKSHK